MTNQSNKTYLLALLLTVSVFLVNAQTPIVQLIQNHNYTRLNLPGTNWGIGTVIRIQNGSEEIVTPNAECLNVKASIALVPIPNYSYEIKPNNEFESNLARIFGDKFNLGHAFRNKNIKKITLSLTSVQETAITSTKIKQKINDFSRSGNDNCIDWITAKQNLVIIGNLSVSKLTYSFFDAMGKPIHLTKGFLKSMGMADSLAFKYADMTALTFSQPIIIGYKAIKFTGVPGMEQTIINSTDVRPSEVDFMKKHTTPTYGILGYSYPPDITEGTAKTIHAYVSIKFPGNKVRDTVAKIVIYDDSTQTGDHIVIVKAIPLYKKITMTLNCMDTVLKVTPDQKDEPKDIDPVNGNSWSWQILAKTADHPSSKLKLMLMTEGPSSSAEKTVIINVHIDSGVLRKVYDYLFNHPAYLVGSILIPLISFLGTRLFKKKKKEEDGEEKQKKKNQEEDNA